MRPHPSSAVTAALAAALLSAVLCAPAGDAQPARLLADISDRPLDHPNRELLPPSTVVLDGVAYFSHDDGVAGQELWRSDGTEAGTWRVRDICPGRCWGKVRGITLAGERLFFLADEGIHGEELWTSDGTAVGTRLVADIAPGLAHSRPLWITAFGARVFFSADDGVHGREPWVSDGTAAGTRLLGDLRPGSAGSQPTGPIAFDGSLLFFADDGVHGHEPWVTDGEAAGTALVVDIRPGPEGSVGPPSQIVPFEGRAWFAADDGVHGRELWASDGTPDATALVADLDPGSWGSNPFDLTPAPGRLYFHAEVAPWGRELFSTDGSSVELVADLKPGTSSSFPRPLAPFDGELYFIARPDALRELWKTDGTPQGTVLVKGSWTDSEIGLASLWPATVAGGQLFFAASSGSGDVAELWRTDGTTDGTRLVRDIAPGLAASLYPLLSHARAIELGDRLFFFADHPDFGWEPWISDGSADGTRLVRDIYSTPSSQFPFLAIDQTFPIDADGRFYFVGANWDSLQEPWTSRGTPQTTYQVAETGSGPSELGYVWPVAAIGRRLILFVRADDEEELWITEADGSGASLLATVEWSGGFGGSLGDRAVFDVWEGRDSHPWVSDGTPAGTQRLTDLASFHGGSPSALAELGGRLYFLAGTAETGDELWTTDGTTAGTNRISELSAALAASSNPLITTSGDRLFFAVHLPETGVELWTSDGTEEGTVPLPEVHPGPERGLLDRTIPGNPTNVSLVPLAGGAAFIGDDGVHGEEPWWSDGVGVMPIGDLRPGARGSEPRWLTAAGDTLFFAADDGVHGRELWRWRPGEAPALVVDLVPGPGSSLPQELADVDGLLYFSAFTPDAGVELWRSDGTAAGTVRLQDIWPGEESSTPSRLTASGRYLFFTADDGTHGREMWSLLLPTRKPRLSLTADGTLFPGAEIVLTLRLENPPPEELPDGDGDEIELPLPALLEIVEVTATSGLVEVTGTAAVGAARVGGPLAATAGATAGPIIHWNGSLPPGGAVEVVVVTRVGPSPSAAIAVQATGAFDSDGDGTNDEPLTSDDPNLPGEENPTVLGLALEIPALEATALVLLAAVLALLALHRVRRVTA